MATKFEIRTEAERYIHNDLSGCSWDFQQRIQKQFDNGDTEGVYHNMMASLVFSAFSIEAKVNFVGWKVLENGWPDRANLREKIDLLQSVLTLELDWGTRPLQTLLQLKSFRDTLAHGKPEVIDNKAVIDVVREVWDALKGQWEASVNLPFVNRCREDEDALWKALISAAGIEAHQTLTHGGHSLKAISEPM